MAAVAKQGAGKPKGRIVAGYDYTDRDGTLLYQVLRLETKSFLGNAARTAMQVDLAA